MQPIETNRYSRHSTHDKPTAQPTCRGAVNFLRSNRGFLAAIETPTLIWLAARMPSWVTPDRLTGMGLVGAILAGVSYAGTSNYPQLLWLASFGLIVNWFGDSLDGSLARYRQIERPRYGFYLDNAVDVIEQLIFTVGLSLSGIIHFELALLGLAVFYTMSIMSLIRAHAFGTFAMDYGGLGPTELRVVFIILNLFVWFLPPQPFEVFGLTMTYPNILSVTWITFTLVVFFTLTCRDLRKLAAEEPPHLRR